MTKVVGSSAAAEPQRDSLRYSHVKSTVALDHDDLTESSGLAVSRRGPRRFWTHNDSGGKPQLYAFDQSGRCTGKCQLKDADADDWEDIASFVQDDRARLIIADSGDNEAKRKSISLYLLDEPDPNDSTKVDSYHEIIVTYPDGPCDCEAVAVDVRRKQILLVAKRALRNGGIYVIPLPHSKIGKASKKKKRTKEKITATRIGTIPIVLVSGMDLNQKTGDIWIVNYFAAYQYPCADREEMIQQQLARESRPHRLPRWKQIEAIAADESGVWISCEGDPGWLAQLSTSN